MQKINQSPWKEVRDEQWTGGGDYLHRREVEGGYLYRNIWIAQGMHHVSMVFVPVERCSCCGDTER